MILQSLANLAKREGLVEDPAYEVKEVHWRITVTQNGQFVALESLLQKPAEGTRGRPRGPSIAVPRPFPGAKLVGVQPDPSFLVGNVSFVCGEDISPDRKYAKRLGELERRFCQFSKLVEEGAETIRDPALQAIATFLRKEEEVAKVCSEVQDRVTKKELASNHLVAFCLAEDEYPYVHHRPIVMDYWAKYRARLTAESESAQCLVTGVVGPVADKHPPIKKVPGGTPSGVAIVSFNKGAFESHGLARNANAPVSRSAAEAYTAALNRLLDPAFPDPKNPTVRLPEQRVLLSPDTAAVFWTDTPSRVPSAITPAIQEGDPAAAKVFGFEMEADASHEALLDDEGTPPSPEPVKGTHEAPWKGIPPAELEDNGAFRLLILSGGQGRATVRAFYTTRISETVHAVRRWFQDVHIKTLRGKPALYRLLASLAVRGDRKNLAPNLAGQIFLAILGGRALPAAVLHAAVRRCRSEADTQVRNGVRRRGLKVRAERAALIKAYLNRARSTLLNQGIQFQEVTAVMNEKERNKGYLLGRIFACVERMQELALGDVGASVTDRYFSSACATPQAVFPRLLKTEVHHYRKAREGERGGSARWLHGQISHLSNWLVGEQNNMQSDETLDAFLRRTAGRPLSGFPAFLPLPEQGLFTLGYHQQRAEFYRKHSSEGPADAAV